MDTKKDADKYFETHPLKDKVFGTTDGFLFEDKRFAIDHSKTLDEAERDVETFVNTNIIDVEFEEVAASETATTKKVVTKPATVKKPVTKPAAKKPVASKPAAKKPVVPKVETPAVEPAADTIKA